MLVRLPQVKHQRRVLFPFQTFPEHYQTQHANIITIIMAKTTLKRKSEGKMDKLMSSSQSFTERHDRAENRLT